MIAWCAAGVIALSLGAGLTSCDFKVERPPDVLVQILNADPAILNPIIAPELASLQVCDYLFDSLVSLDNTTYEPIPRLAKGWGISPDGLTFTFHLNEKAKWHDGEPLTASDVVFTFDAIRDKRVPAGMYRSYLADLQSVVAVDPYTVRFTFSKPYFKAFSFVSQIKIIPRHTFSDLGRFAGNDANRHPIGSGPYKFKSWVTGNRVEIERYDDYFGERPDIRGIVFKVIPDKAVAFNLLAKGAADTGEMTPIQWRFEAGDKDFKREFTMHKFYPPNFSFIGWNLRRPFFSDRRVRTAMAMLIDRDKILDKLMFGLGEPITGPFYLFGRNYDRSIKPYPFDPRAAARLLDEAGWVDHDGDGIRDKDGVPFRFTMLVKSGDNLGLGVGLMLKKALSDAGIAMEISEFEWATMVARLMRRDFDAAFFVYAMPLVEDPYNLWHSSGVEKGANLIGFADKDADKILEEARAEMDAGKRSEMFRELHGMIYKEQPGIFLYMLPTLDAISSRFQNVVDYKVAPDVLEWKVGPSELLWEW
jgi:peptide/nickel transport system substrate-binding protein